MDRALGRLLDGLEERVPSRDRLVVVVGDHGESLDLPAARPYGHGLDVDLVATHVPFVVHGTGRWSSAVPAGTVVRPPVGLMDVAPTVSGLVGLPADPTAGGLDLSRVWSGAEPAERPLFSEATKPVSSETPAAWNNLHKERAVVAKGALLTQTPWETQTAPSLFELAVGQPELEDEIIEESLLGYLHAWDQSAPDYRDAAMSEDTRAALEALGYLER